MNEAFVVETEVFERDFHTWLAPKKNLTVPRQELGDYLEQLDPEKKTKRK